MLRLHSTLLTVMKYGELSLQSDNREISGERSGAQKEGSLACILNKAPGKTNAAVMLM